MTEKRRSTLSIKDCQFLQDKKPRGIYDKSTLKRLYAIIDRLEKNKALASSQERVLLRRFRKAQFGYLLRNNETAESPLNVKGVLQIDGKFDGEINGPETLVLGESSVLNAHIKAGTLVCKGILRGKANVSQKIEIHKTGCVLANVSTPSIEIAEGGVFKGKCHMTEKPKVIRNRTILKLRRFFLAG